MSFQGLVNEGATCYLNSLLQTLFMTYQFRDNVYSYVYKVPYSAMIHEKLHKKTVFPFNCKNFSQTCKHKEELVFQWTEAQAFQQHDVQEFCRKLFDAIEMSHKNTFWIKELFGFLISSYIDCGAHRSTRPEEYLDLSLPVRNQYTHQLYDSLEECLKAYLMPEEMEGVECSGCQAKVSVKKGMSLESLPVILTLQLNRFELNYDTMQRQKINSFLYYPEILQLHRLLHPYEQIQLTGIPPALHQHTVTRPKEKSRRTQDLFPTADPPKKRKNSDDKIVAGGNKEHVSYFDEQNKHKRKPEEKILSKEQQKHKNLEILASLKQQRIPESKQKKQPKQQVQQSIEEDMLFGTLAAGFKFDQPSTLQKPTFETTETRYQHEQNTFEWGKEYTEGTYALYAVLVHSGGSYGGHYYAYISDGRDWYKFDDARVSKVTRTEMRQYGSNSNTSSGTNAYLLFYRNVKTFKDLSRLEIPSQLLQKVKIENQKSEKRQELNKISASDRERRLQQINSVLIVKVFPPNHSASAPAEPLTLRIEDRRSETVEQLRQRVKNSLQMNEQDCNWRLRRYNKTDDSMHEVYQGTPTLQSLGFRENVYIIVEKKSSEEVFEEYDPRRIIVKVNVWRPNIIMVAEKKLRPLRININQLSPYSELYAAIQQQTGIENPLVIRRNYTSSKPISTLPLQLGSQRLIDLRFFNNINLYVEEGGETEARWGKEFEKERFRCSIRFNNPKIGEARDQELYFDSRRTLGELKKELSSVIGIPEEMFRIKKGKQMPQLTAFRKRLSDLRFINNQILYLEEGRSSSGSIVVRRGTVELSDGQLEFSVHEELQFDLTNDLVLASDLARKIAESTGIPAQHIRLRECSAGQFKEIFSEQQLLMRLRNKNVVWQLTSGEKPRGTQFYYRVFDLLTMEVGPLKELFIDNTASCEEFALVLQEETGIPSDQVLLHHPISTYCDVAALLDCPWLQVKFIPDVVKEDPLFLRCDGDFFVVRKADEPYKPPKIQKKPQGSTTQTKEKAGQAQLQITVIAEKDQPESVEGDATVEQVVAKESQ